MAWLFPWMLLLHVLGAIVAFGPTFAFPLIGASAAGEPQHANFATRVTYTISRRLVVPVALTLAITGGAMIAIRGYNLADRALLWLDVAIALYVIALAFSIFVNLPRVARLIEMTSAPPPPGAAGPPPAIAALIRQVQLGGMLLMVLVISIATLMVVKPGFAG
jgi:uncharacterized membrane protein